MNSRLAVVAVIAGSALLSPTDLKAAYLLSGNATNGGVFATNTPKIATGATYSYLYGNLDNVRGNTDKALIDQDTNLTKLKDGTAEAAGASYATYGTWNGGTGTGTGSGPFAANVATVLFDLKDIYTLSSAVVSTSFKTNSTGSALQVGIGTFEIWTSIDGITYTQAGTWTDVSPFKGATSQSENRSALLTITLSSIKAQYVMFYMSRMSDSSNHLSANQMDLGELAVFGDSLTVPETASLLTLLAGCPLLLKFRRR